MNWLISDDILFEEIKVHHSLYSIVGSHEFNDASKQLSSSEYKKKFTNFLNTKKQANKPAFKSTIIDLKSKNKVNEFKSNYWLCK